MSWKRCLKISLCSLFALFASTVQAQLFSQKLFQRSAERSFVELERKQARILGEQRTFIGGTFFNPGRNNKEIPPFTVIALARPVEKQSGDTTERLSHFAYGGPKFFIPLAQRRNFQAHIYTIVVVGTARYEKNENNSSFETNGLYFGLEPGMRLHWNAWRKWWLGTGVSVVSGTLEGGHDISTGPSFDLSLVYRW